MTQSPVQQVDAPPPGDRNDEDRGLELNARSVLTLSGFLAAAVLGLYLLLPQLAGLQDTWNRIENGSPVWIGVAFVLTFGMFAGYVAMFRGIFASAGSERIGWRESYLITMAGLAASRIFAAGGAGGLVLQAWALRQAWLPRRVVADKTISFLVLTYAPYAVAVVVCGFGLALGIFPGEAPFTMTVVPAIIALILMGLCFLILLVPVDLQRRLEGYAKRTGMLGNLLPIPGGVGGVEGGMIGAFAAFGVDAGLAVVAVLVFRAFTFWLPLVPGAIAFFRLRATVERWRREGRATIQSEA